MAHLKVMHILNMTSGIPQDVAVNTFHFDCLLLPDPVTDIFDVLEACYDNFRSQFPATVAQNGHQMKAYNMGDPEPRAPIAEYTYNFTSAPEGVPTASELAICLSFQGDRVSGETQRRRRGRVYLGPTERDSSTTAGRPNSDLVNATAAFGLYLLEASNLNAEYTWAVYSTVNDDLVPVTNGWVDNAYDVQRRRGLQPTSRTTFSD